jgi:hypothetical protein
MEAPFRLKNATTSTAEFRVQVHPDRAPELDLSLLEREFSRVVAQMPSTVRAKVENEELLERHLNLVVETRNRKQLWESLLVSLYQHPVIGLHLAASSIALCTGANRWNDYLLLHHYDSSVQVDECTEA